MLRSSIQMTTRNPSLLSPASQFARRFSVSPKRLCSPGAACSHSHACSHTPSNIRKSSTTALPHVPEEQWAQVLEQKGGRK